MRSAIPLSLLALASAALAKTDLEGCTYTDTVSFGGAYRIWYVKDTGELCKFLDCGGGRAPPKYNVPGCNQYTGTATYSPSWMPGWGPDGYSGPTTTPKTGATTTGRSQPQVTSATVTSSSSSSSIQSASSSERTGFEQQSALTTTAPNTSSDPTPSTTGTSPITGAQQSSSKTSTPNAAATPLGLTGKGLFGLAAGVIAAVL